MTDFDKISGEMLLFSPQPPIFGESIIGLPRNKKVEPITM